MRVLKYYQSKDVISLFKSNIQMKSIIDTSENIICNLLVVKQKIHLMNNITYKFISTKTKGTIHYTKILLKVKG